MKNYDQWFIDFISKYEDFKPEAYFDEIGKKWTIGYGTTIYPDGTSVKKGDTITKEEAIRLIPDYLTRNASTYLQYFSNWNKMPRLTLYALMNIAYRGGPYNFKTDSPKFAKAVNDAYADGKLTLLEYLNILKEMDFSHKDNLLDRSERTAAMIADSYNPDDNKSIGYATTSKSPYKNYHNNVLYPGNMWNSIFHTNQSDANFVGRLKTINRDSIDLGNGLYGTHLLSYVTEDGYDVVFPMILEVSPKFTFFGLDKPKLVEFKDWRKAYGSAVLNGDTVHLKSGMGEPFTTKYKKYYPGFNKQGGNINYLNIFK